VVKIWVDSRRTEQGEEEKKRKKGKECPHICIHRLNKKGGKGGPQRKGMGKKGGEKLVKQKKSMDGWSKAKGKKKPGKSG